MEIEIIEPDRTEPPLESLDFAECAHCSMKPGSPLLCSGCLHNRRVIHALKLKLEEATEKKGFLAWLFQKR